MSDGLSRGLPRIEAERKLAPSWKYQIGIISSLSLIVIAVLLIKLFSLENLEHIGAFVSGIGQISALIWIVITFRSQTEDIELQRRELAQQRMALEETAKVAQQSLTLDLFKYNKKRLDRIARNIVSCAGSENGTMRDLSILYSHGNDDAYMEFLSRSDETLMALRERLADGDQTIYSYLNDYMSFYQMIIDSLSNIDQQGVVISALISGSPSQEFNNFAKSLLVAYTERISSSNDD